MDMQIKFKLIKDGKVVGYETHNLIVNDPEHCSTDFSKYGIQIWHNNCNVSGNNVHAFMVSEAWINHDTKLLFTGQLDKNDTEIYDRDKLYCAREKYEGSVCWSNGGGFITDCEGFGDHPLIEIDPDEIEVIGNQLISNMPMSLTPNLRF